MPIEKQENNDNLDGSQQLDIDSFEFVSEAEMQESAQALKQTRMGNSDIDKQLERDIEMLAQAIVNYGGLESDKVKAHSLLKCILLLYFSDICYRDKQDHTFHSWSELKEYSKLGTFPIAAVLLHGSRALIQFSSELSTQLFDWLVIDKASWRYVATHGIRELEKSKQERLPNGLKKYLKEVKVNFFNAAASLLVKKPVTGLVNYAYDAASAVLPMMVATDDKKDSSEKSACLEADLSPSYADHYGINLALGGAGNHNFFSGNTISGNGEHGHLYVHCHHPQGGQHGGLLLGIEQSAPRMNDQYGGSHDVRASDKAYSASGGDFFCKPPKDHEWGDAYIGLTRLPIADYYDSLWNEISEETFILIQEAYRKANSLLDFLPTAEEKLNFIKEIVASSGKQNAEGFNRLFEKYVVKTPMLALQPNKLVETKDLQGLDGRKVDAIPIFYPILVPQIKGIRLEQEALKKLAIDFMETVKKNMGWFYRDSKKEILFTQLITKLNEVEASRQEMVWLLKNFIRTALMNRYDQRGETHSGRACLNLLNTQYASSLKKLLFPNIEKPLHYSHLFFSEEGTKNDNKNTGKLLSSARYQGSLYSAFGMTKNTKTASTEKLNSALKAFVYQPSV
jgi:hypothetical protein